MSSPKLGAAGRPRRVVVGARRTRRAPGARPLPSVHRVTTMTGRDPVGSDFVSPDEKKALEIVRYVGASLKGWESAARAAGLGADEIDLMQTVIVGQP